MRALPKSATWRFPLASNAAWYGRLNCPSEDPWAPHTARGAIAPEAGAADGALVGAGAVVAWTARLVGRGAVGWAGSVGATCWAGWLVAVLRDEGMTVGV